MEKTSMQLSKETRNRIGQLGYVLDDDDRLTHEEVVIRLIQLHNAVENVDEILAEADEIDPEL